MWYRYHTEGGTKVKRVKKFVTLALAAMMLVGCGGNTGEEESPDVKIVKIWVHKSEAEDEGKVYSCCRFI